MGTFCISLVGHIMAWKEAAVSISVSAPAAFNCLISLVCVGVSAPAGAGGGHDTAAAQNL
jgi:hypothetical protein